MDCFDRFRLFAAFGGNYRRGNRRSGDCVRGDLGLGTLIHNGNSHQTLPIGLLAVPLVKPSLERSTMSKVCGSTLFPSRSMAAEVAAIPMAAIATAADPKYRAALVPPAKSLSESIFDGVSHSHPKARLDNSCRKWQPSAGYLRNLSNESCSQWAPVADTIGASSTRPST